MIPLVNKTPHIKEQSYAKARRKVRIFFIQAEENEQVQFPLR